MELEVAGPVLVSAAVCKPSAPGGSQLGAFPAQRTARGLAGLFVSWFLASPDPFQPSLLLGGREAVALHWEQGFGGAAETEAAGKSRHGRCTPGWGGLTVSRERVPC